MASSSIAPLPGVCTVVRAAFPELTALPHVVVCISSLLDYSSLFTVERASATGDLRLLQRVVRRSAGYIDQPGVLAAAVAQAARYGHLRIVQWLMDRYWREDGLDVTGAMVQAARHGHLPVMEWLNTNCPHAFRWTGKMKVVAAIEGHFEIVRWLYEHSTGEGSTFVMDYAADHGDLEMLKWLQVHSSDGCSQHAMDNAARRGNLEVLQWLHENRTEGCTYGAMDSAAMEGHLHVLQWLHANRQEGCSNSALHFAAVEGHANAVRWLVENRPEGDRRQAFLSAVRWGHLEVAKVLEAFYPPGTPANGPDRSLAAVEIAAHFGHVDTLEWLISSGLIESWCKFDDVVRLAAQTQHLDVQLWLQDHRVEFEFEAAAEGGSRLHEMY